MTTILRSELYSFWSMTSITVDNICAWPSFMDVYASLGIHQPLWARTVKRLALFLWLMGRLGIIPCHVGLRPRRFEIYISLHSFKEPFKKTFNFLNPQTENVKIYSCAQKEASDWMFPFKSDGWSAAALRVVSQQPHSIGKALFF